MGSLRAVPAQNTIAGTARLVIIFLPVRTPTQMRRFYHLAVIPQPTHLVHLFWPPDGFSQPVSSLTGHPLGGRVSMAAHFDDSNCAAVVLAGENSYS